MKGMEKIGEAILDKVRAEAESIIKEAEGKAAKEIEQAKKQQAAKLEEEKGKMLQEAKEEADRSSLIDLIREATEVLGFDKGRVYAAPKDISTVKKLLEKDRGLASKIVEVREHECLGGVIVEDISGRTRIDNTYETRLEMLLPRLLPEIGRELF